MDEPKFYFIGDDIPANKQFHRPTLLSGIVTAIGAAGLGFTMYSILKTMVVTPPRPRRVMARRWAWLVASS